VLATMPRMTQPVHVTAHFGASGVLSPAPAMITITGHIPGVAVRQYITVDHRWTALHAARLCGQLEPQLQTNDPKVEHRSLAMTAIFFAGAFRDALVNEVILDVIEPPGGVPSARVAGLPIDTTTITAFKKVKKEPSTLGKYQQALAAAGKLPYTETRDPYKSALLLIRFRNHLVHFKPKTRDIHTDHEFEELFMKAKIVENQQDIGLPWFPNKALGAGLAQWACDSSWRFARSWWNRIGLRRSFDTAFDKLAP